MEEDRRMGERQGVGVALQRQGVCLETLVCLDKGI